MADPGGTFPGFSRAGRFEPFRALDGYGARIVAGRIRRCGELSVNLGGARRLRKMAHETRWSMHRYQWRMGMRVSGGIYGMAFIGAMVYYFQHAATFWAGLIGFFKALFWPAVLMYKLLE